MSVSVVMPQLGESVTEGSVIRWLKKEGEWVQADEPLLEVSTDKVDTEIPSPATGFLRGIAVWEDETVAVGAQLAVIEDAADAPAPATAAPARAPSPQSALNGPPEDRHKVPDTLLDGADLERLSVRGASLRGDEHRATGVTRQDSAGIYRVRGGEVDAVLGCVADGAANATLSQLGAAEACRLVRDETRQRLPELFGARTAPDLDAVCEDLVESVDRRLARRATFLKAEPADLATALTAAVVETSAGPDGHRYVVFLVGHGTAWQLSGERFTALLPRARARKPGLRAEVLSAEPPFVATGLLPPGSTLIVCTTGLARPFSEPEITERIAAWWGRGPVPSLIEFGWQLSFHQAGYADDRSAVCFWAT
jgi:pyruvate/2-oxoglutarate dehydrogenase complex dihydrolipoamide acyltransferase (E2) component